VERSEGNFLSGVKGEGEIVIEISAAWKSAFPETSFGILAIERIANTQTHPSIEEKKNILENALRKAWQGKTRAEMRKAFPFEAYERYFRGFGQGYPVLAQLESVALRGKPVFSPSALVSAMFMAELENGFLTAGHDLDKIRPPLRLDVALGKETYLAMGGRERRLQEGDMFLEDGNGILSSILYGPDNRTFITEATSRALFTVYGVPSIHGKDLREHLEAIETLVRALSPQAIRTDLRILP
jgi:DNA/RNA-binding domain of Phe-tRNA-synthetase-like protein